MASALLLVLLSGQSAPAETLLHGEGLLWRIERPGLAPSYLFGTIHATDERVRELPRPVADAIAATDSLTLEMVITDDVMAELAERMVISDGRLLDEILGLELFAQTAAVGARYGIPEVGLKLVRPWSVWMLFSFPPEEIARQAAGEPALDVMLQADAMSQDKPVYGLENMDEQLALFEGLSESEHIAILTSVVAANGEIGDMFERLIRDYLARDLNAIRAFFFEQTAPADAELVELITERFINVRNELMASRMAPRLAEGDSFIAVGALHLPGERGVLHLLELQGYQIFRVY
ncbi:MAG: TraB/GumN family protein [Alphaproteobacteria bacterium]